MNFQEWCKRWGIPPQAVLELSKINDESTHRPEDGESEASVQTNIRVEASQKGLRLWRNNVGAYKTDDGAFVRYGLANESKNMNIRIKSSDLIGIRPVIVTPEMVGSVIGQFVAREVKAAKWKFSGNNDRAVAQERFIKLVNSFGGDACFANSTGTL